LELSCNFKEKILRIEPILVGFTGALMPVLLCLIINAQESQLREAEKLFNVSESASVQKPVPLLPEEASILDAYRNELTREGVVSIFGNITGSEDLAAVILAKASAFDVSPCLAFALCWEESQYNSRAVNRRNKNRSTDWGLFQLNSASFPDLREKEFFDPELNAYYGMAHLSMCLQSGGSEATGLAMYNAGVNRVRSGKTPRNTREYVSRILKNQQNIEERFWDEASARSVFMAPSATASFGEESWGETKGLDNEIAKLSPPQNGLLALFF
jgi:soluble lytic murein transglycosylase-like protein